MSTPSIGREQRQTLQRTSHGNLPGKNAEAKAQERPDEGLNIITLAQGVLVVHRHSHVGQRALHGCVGRHDLADLV